MSQINSGDGMELAFPWPCRCGGMPIKLPPDEFHDYYSVLCEREPLSHGQVDGATEQEAILTWNKLQEGQE